MAILWISFFFVVELAGISACPDECSCFGFSGSWIADCSRRNLSSIPSGFPKNTTEIFLQYNNIEEITEDAFLSLHELRFLHLHENLVSNIHELAFTNASMTLEYLTLSGNQITDLSEKVFAGMSSLKVLNLNNNFLTSLHENLLQDLVKGVQVSACNNRINSIGESTLNSTSLLRYVGFSQNNLSKIPFALGRAASELYVLDYAENNLRELPQIPKTLRQIYLTGNHIKRISFQPLENATMLYELFLHDNDVEEIEENAFAHSPLIGWLDLSKNNLSKVEGDMFRHLVDLKGLNLTENILLDSISAASLTPFKDTLIRFSFDQCSLTNLDPAVITSLKHNNLYVWAGNNPWDCDCALQDFANVVREQPQMFYDINLMLCIHPKHLEGVRIDNVSQAEYSSACYVNPDPSIDETALIISMSIIGSIALAAIVIFFILKAKKNRTSNIWLGSNETISTEASLHQLEREVSS